MSTTSRPFVRMMIFGLVVVVTTVWMIYEVPFWSKGITKISGATIASYTLLAVYFGYYFNEWKTAALLDSKNPNEDAK